MLLLIGICHCHSIRSDFIIIGFIKLIIKMMMMTMIYGVHDDHLW